MYCNYCSIKKEMMVGRNQRLPLVAGFSTRPYKYNAIGGSELMSGLTSKDDICLFPGKIIS